jgi:hypothetical protein
MKNRSHITAWSPICCFLFFIHAAFLGLFRPFSGFQLTLNAAKSGTKTLHTRGVVRWFVAWSRNWGSGDAACFNYSAVNVSGNAILKVRLRQEHQCAHTAYNYNVIVSVLKTLTITFALPECTTWEKSNVSRRAWTPQEHHWVSCCNFCVDAKA